MRKLNLFLMGIFILFSATAQEKVEKYAVFHLSFVPPLSTNGIKASEYTNGISFNLLAGISRNEKNFFICRTKQCGNQ